MIRRALAFMFLWQCALTLALFLAFLFLWWLVLVYVPNGGSAVVRCPEHHSPRVCPVAPTPTPLADPTGW